MSLQKIASQLTDHVAALRAKGTAKGNEKIITGIKSAEAGFSERYYLDGYGNRAFLRMNSNAYLGLARHRQLIDAETRAAEQFGTGPGAVRFISGTYRPHIELEQALAAFHGREAAMIMSAAYATVVGVLPQLVTNSTLVVSDALNHNCIINAIRLSQPADKAVYPHLDMKALEQLLVANQGRVKRVCVVTDGIFSMRGDHAPLHEITALCQQYEGEYAEGIITIVDDSHGVGALGTTGRGTEEYTTAKADILIATLGKALGVNGGYVVSDASVIAYLRESAPLYIYSNPITPAEAAAAHKALQILDSAEGLAALAQLRKLGSKLRAGLQGLGYETLMSDHPIVPIFIRDTAKTAALVEHLFAHNILVTGLNYPVVPKGDEEIRLQLSASHTEKDVAYLLEQLQRFG
ncbi:MAG: aminotransferase class I/II-fold pyridoxal phosphate-dependent enzyme [Candidatus Binatia bacterium]